jgi:hypothetical protein
MSSKMNMSQAKALKGKRRRKKKQGKGSPLKLDAGAPGSSSIGAADTFDMGGSCCSRISLRGPNRLASLFRLDQVGEKEVAMKASATMMLLCLGGVVVADRTQLTFDYNWRFKFGEPTTASPPLSTASEDQSFTKDVSNHTCTQVGVLPMA